MAERIALDPAREGRIFVPLPLEAGIMVCQGLVGVRGKVRLEAFEFLFRHDRRAVCQVRPLRFDCGGESGGCQFAHQDFDARLVLVVAAAEAVVDAQDGVEIIDQFGARDEFADHRSDHWRAAEAAADDYPCAELAVVIF